MGQELKTRLQIFVAILRAAAGFYALYILETLRGPLHNPAGFAFLILAYPIATDILIFLRPPIILSIVIVLDSLACLGVAYLHTALLIPILFLPPLLVGLSSKHFKLHFLVLNLFLQGAVIGYFYQKEVRVFNPFLLHFSVEMIFADFIGIILAYGIFRTLKELEQNRSLLGLIQIGQQMGVSLNYEKVAALLMKVLTSMFDAHSYGLYVVEGGDEEKMAVIRGVDGPYSEVFLNFNMEAKDVLFAQVLSEKQVRAVDDLRAINDRFLPRIRTFKGALLAPICFEEEALGLIFLISPSTRAYGAEEAALLALLSNQFAVTLKNIVLYQQTATMAITDSLTGLYTHGYFQDQLIKQVTDHKYAKKPLSVMILDVDHFKLINDRYGHPQGDYILRQMAGLVKNNVRPKDLVCRYGGDEFVLIVPGLDRLSAATYAERIRKSVEDYQFMAGGKIARITISAGVSSLPETAETPKELIEAADKALYEAKNRGRNRIVYL